MAATHEVNGTHLHVRRASRRAGGRIAGLPKSVKVSELNRFFGFRSEGESGDGKVSREWTGEVGGAPVSVWDYRGARWSVGGSMAGALLLAQVLGVELER